MDVVGAQVVIELARHSVGLRDLLGLQPVALEHVVEVGVAADVQLHRALEPHAALAEEPRQRAVNDRRADLTLDVVADDRQPLRLEALAPVLLAPNEDGDAVDEAAAGLQHLLDVPLSCRLTADGQIVDDHVGASVAQDVDDVGGGPWRLGDDLREILAQAVMGHAAHHGHLLDGNGSEFVRVVRAREDRLAEVLADLLLVDVDGGGELDVVDVISAQIDVHQAGDEVILGGVLVVLDALDQRRSAVAHADDRYPYFLFAQCALPPVDSRPFMSCVARKLLCACLAAGPLSRADARPARPAAFRMVPRGARRA